LSLLDAGQMNRNDQLLRSRRTLLGMRLSRQRNMLSFHLGPHLHGIIEAQDFMRIIDEQIEMLKEVSRENSTNFPVCQLCLSKVLDDRQYIFDLVGTGFHRIELRKGSAGEDPHPGHPGHFPCPELEFGGQGRIHGRDLGAGVQHKVVRSSMVDRDPHNYL
jgi:hypothetical protein